MTWIVIMALALLAFLIAVFVFKAPSGTREAIGAALLLGIAGYALQGSPDEPGAPKAAPADAISDPAALVKARGEVSNREGLPTNRWIVIADALARNGQYADASQVLLGAVEHDPGNAEAWLAIGNALVAHAEGYLTPAALFAYNKAQAADPKSPGPPFFLGMALAQSGRFAEARSTWADLLKRSPEKAPWRKDLEGRLQRLDMIIAAQGGQQPGSQ